MIMFKKRNKKPAKSNMIPVKNKEKFDALLQFLSTFYLFIYLMNGISSLFNTVITRNMYISTKYERPEYALLSELNIIYNIFERRFKYSNRCIEKINYITYNVS